MDPATLAQQVMTALTPLLPYLTSAGTAIAGKIGEDAYQRGKKLFQAIQARFAHEPDEKASKALQAFVEDPDLAGSVEIKLARIIQNDPTFAQTLLQILQATVPQQSIELSDRAQASENEMEIRGGRGSQSIKASDEARAEKNKFKIGD